MPADREDEPGRRSVVPTAAGRSLWLAAAWTGVGAAAVCATLSIVCVAIVWMPASGASGHAISTLRAGLLTFLAALHGGVTVDGTAGQFLPLGLLVVVALTAWRAGSGLADAAEVLGESDPVRLAVAGGAQAASFTAAALVAVPFAELGTSSAPFLGVGAAALVLFTVTGGVAFVRSSALSPWIVERLPANIGTVARAAAAGVGVYLGFGALLVAGSLVAHHARVEALSLDVGGGWSSVPILLLGVLAAPNGVIAGASYLAGPGFAVGSGTTVSAFSTAHGVLPAFPLLGALPTGHGATPLVWALVVATPLAAGLVVARVTSSAGTLLMRLRDAALGSAGAGVAMAVLAWQGGGGVGSGRLSVVGASPWQAGLAVGAETAAVSGLALGVAALWRYVAGGRPSAEFAGAWTPTSRSRQAVGATGVAEVTPAGDADGADQLAG